MSSCLEKEIQPKPTDELEWNAKYIQRIKEKARKWEYLKNKEEKLDQEKLIIQWEPKSKLIVILNVNV